jgi:hypothetical protein
MSTRNTLNSNLSPSLALVSSTNSSFFHPIYPLPAYVIYRVFIDDDTCYNEEHNKNNTLFKLFIFISHLILIFFNSNEIE